MNDLTQDLRDYRAYLESELAIMAKATNRPWVSDAEEYSVFGADNTVVAECYYNEPEVDEANREAIAASGNGYEPSLRAQLRMLEGLESLSLRRPIMGSRGDYRIGQEHCLESIVDQAEQIMCDIIAAWRKK